MDCGTTPSERLTTFLSLKPSFHDRPTLDVVTGPAKFRLGPVSNIYRGEGRLVSQGLLPLGLGLRRAKSGRSATRLQTVRPYQNSQGSTMGDTYPFCSELGISIPIDLHLAFTHYDITKANNT
jgi:hypothetical protein